MTDEGYMTVTQLLDYYERDLSDVVKTNNKLFEDSLLQPSLIELLLDANF